MKTINKFRRLILGHYRFFLLKLFKGHFNVGKSFYCGRGCFVSRKNTISIGHNFYMGNYCHLAANAKIGSDVLFASFVSLVGGDHKVDFINTSIKDSGRDEFKEIIIEDNIWIGHGAILMHGIRIREGAIIAAGSIVTKNVGENEIWGGNPAQLIRKRKI